MSDYIDKKSAYNTTFLPTFRQNLQQAKQKHNRNEAFEDLYNTDTSYAPDFSYLLVPDQTSYQNWHRRGYATRNFVSTTSLSSMPANQNGT